jgi:hypothetical protein
MILFFSFFKPAYKVGGPVKSVVELASVLQSNILIISPKKDLDGTVIQYVNTYNIQIFTYLHFSTFIFFRAVKKNKIRVIYINSVYDFENIILAIFHKLIWKSNIILSPRGQLMNGALNIKKIKKSIYLFFFGRIINFIDIIHFTDISEKNEFEKLNIQFNNKQIVIPNLIDFTLYDKQIILKLKKCKLNCVFYSRIVKKKNLLSLLKNFTNLDQTKFTLSIYGIIEDQDYWQSCKTYINNKNIFYKGEIKFKSDIKKIFSCYDLFILLTDSENFGHVLYEAILCKLPLLISDKTPLTEEVIKYDLGKIIFNLNDFDITIHEVYNNILHNPYFYQNAIINYIEDYLLTNNNKNKEKYKKLFHVN